MDQSQTSNPAGSPKVTDTTPARPAQGSTPEEFKRFQDLTRKLTKVPKSALDQKRQTT